MPTLIEVDFVPAFLPFYTDHKRFKFVYGGRGSAKSTSLADTFLLIGRETKRGPKRFLCTREIQKSIRDSVHALLKDRIEIHGYPDYKVYESAIRNLATGSEFLFTGLREHNINTIKSFEGIDYCWVEEAQAVSQKSLDILTPTIRKAGSEICFSYNRMGMLDPVHKLFMRECSTEAVKRTFKPNWCKGTYVWYEYRGEDAIGVYINYDGNPYFPDELRKEMEKDKDDNPSLYRHKWLGEPESHGDDTLISRERALQAVLRSVDAWEYISFGVDPARYGDDESAIAIREGFRVLPINRFNGINTSELTGRVLHKAREYYASGYRDKIRVKVDDTGVGAGVTDQLKGAAEDESIKGDPEFNIEVIPVVNNGVASDPKYANIGAQMWGNMGEALKTMSIPDDLILIEQMATRRYKIKPDGRIILERKEDMKKRSLTSPDRADALALCLLEEYGVQFDADETFESARGSVFK